jgi:23S rRNA pseudouridine1911/1915/1917 synthase
VVINGDIASASGEFQGDSLADTLAGAGHQRGLRLEGERHSSVEYNVRFSAEQDGARLDHFLHQRLPEHSRSRLQEWIKAGRVLVNGKPARASYGVRPGDALDVEPADPPPLRATPEEIPLRILYEDHDVVAIDKPAGMAVHAGAGIHSGTLVNALLHRFGALSGVGGPLRPGIVHRLDRFTSGVLLVAKNDAAHQNLAAQFS